MNKFTHGGAFEQFVQRRYPDLYSEIPQCKDFWEHMYDVWPEILSEFKHMNPPSRWNRKDFAAWIATVEEAEDYPSRM